MFVGGAWLFRIHCREVVALGLFGLGRVTFYVYSVYVLGLFSSPLGVPEVSLRNPVQECSLLCLSSDLGGVWLFRIHCREAAALGVWARLRHVFCLRTGACFFSFRGSRGATSQPCEGWLFASSEPGFRWGCRFGFVRARLRHVFCLRIYVLELVSSPLGVPEVPLRNPAKEGFLLRLRPDLGGVWLFCIHCREVAALGLSGFLLL